MEIKTTFKEKLAIGAVVAIGIGAATQCGHDGHTVTAAETASLLPNAVVSGAASDLAAARAAGLEVHGFDPNTFHCTTEVARGTDSHHVVAEMIGNEPLPGAGVDFQGFYAGPDPSHHATVDHAGYFASTDFTLDGLEQVRASVEVPLELGSNHATVPVECDMFDFQALHRS
ncbi:MAG TPA: hypothetical protein VJP80_04510 [Candidatus Saccharimonadales bacterium]|nr:hypothetical protein [Candidatus Saccharimonadales bacterium]